MIMGKEEQSFGKKPGALVVLDRATRFMGGYPAVTNSTQTTVSGFQSFYSIVVRKLIFSDNSGELRKACDVLNYSQDTSTPHRPQSNGVAERAVRRCKEGTSCQIQQSGFMAAWWDWAMPAFSALYSITEKVVVKGGTQMTPYQAKFGEDVFFLKDAIIQFGAELEYKPTDPDYIEKQHVFGDKLRSGIKLCYHLHQGGKWSGDLYVADWEQILTAQHPSHIYPTRIRRKDIFLRRCCMTSFVFQLLKEP